MKVGCAILIFLVLGACGDDGQSCLIENRVSALADPVATDCGTLAIDDDDAAYVAAHDCVAGAIALQTPFAVQWDLQGIDSRVARALLGKGAGPGLQFHLLSFDGDPSGGGGSGNPHTTTFLCANLVDQGQCADVRSTLCFDCANSTITDECP